MSVIRSRLRDILVERIQDGPDSKTNLNGNDAPQLPSILIGGESSGQDRNSLASNLSDLQLDVSSFEQAHHDQQQQLDDNRCGVAQTERDRPERSVEVQRTLDDFQKRRFETVQTGSTNGSPLSPGVNAIIASLLMMGMNPMRGNPQQMFAGQQMGVEMDMGPVSPMMAE